LPAELRDEIYRLCLISSEEYIWIDKETRSPPLLSVCCQIRQEAIEIWYLSNKFMIKVEGCDTALYQAYMSNVIEPLDIAIPFDARLAIYLPRDYIEWANPDGMVPRSLERKT
jgi:hypothetical protein